MAKYWWYRRVFEYLNLTYKNFKGERQTITKYPEECSQEEGGGRGQRREWVDPCDFCL